MTLPTPPSTLRTSKLSVKNSENGSELSEFQEELVWLSSSINGDQVPECSTVEDAAQYVLNSVTKFFDAAATAKTQPGLDPNQPL